MYRNNVPFNIRIPVRIREHTIYLFISQLGYVILDMEKFLRGNIIKYKKNKVKFHMQFKNDRKIYVMVIHNNVPNQYKDFIQFIGSIYYKKDKKRCYLDQIFIYKNEYQNAMAPPPPNYEEIF